MRILLTGISCVGKTTVGKILAERLQYHFFDLDDEIEKYFGESIERLKARYRMEHDFRYEIGVIVFKDILFKRDSSDCVIAMPPSGLKDAYLRTIRKIDCIVVAINDTPENILKSEPPRDCRRLHFVRGWSHETAKQIFSGSKRASGSDGIRSFI